MMTTRRISLLTIFKSFKIRIGATWLLVLVETIGIALIPLAMGIAIDGVLEGSPQAMLWLGGLLVALTVSGVLRRIYDTRIYCAIRVQLGTHLDKQMPNLDVSLKSAHLDMSRELVDFLEEELPDLITALVQIAITLAVLTAYDLRLSLSAACMTAAMIAIYGMFHLPMYRCNEGFNSQMEQQVSVLSTGKPRRLLAHLLTLKKWEVRLSDREAVMYGLIFLAVAVFIVYNLWTSAHLDNMTPGRLFTILSYSWEYVEAAITLPIILSIFTRVREITQRLARHMDAVKND